MCNAVDFWLYTAVLRMKRCAELISAYFAYVEMNHQEAPENEVPDIKLPFTVFRISGFLLTTGVNTKSAKTVDKFFSVQPIAVSPFILPLKNCALFRIRRNRFTVFQPAWAYIVVKNDQWYLPPSVFSPLPEYLSYLC